VSIVFSSQLGICEILFVSVSRSILKSTAISVSRSIRSVGINCYWCYSAEFLSFLCDISLLHTICLCFCVCCFTHTENFTFKGILISMVDVQSDNSNNATSSTVRMDIASPFYLHPSENAGSTLLPTVFDGTGYRSWRRAVLRALSVKSKTGFINGKIMKPDSEDPSFAHWERCDDMVTSWILNSLSPELRDGLQYVNNARELWEELENRYDQTNGCKLYQLQKEINDLVQGSLDVTGYYTQMKKL